MVMFPGVDKIFLFLVGTHIAHIAMKLGSLDISGKNVCCFLLMFSVGESLGLSLLQ